MIIIFQVFDYEVLLYNLSWCLIQFRDHFKRSVV